MNPDLLRLYPYPFERLATLKAGITPPDHLTHIAMSIGEPKHPAPEFIHDILTEKLSSLASYPLTKGMLQLRETIAQWLVTRFNLDAGDIDPERHILPVNGTREALFAIAQAIVNRSTTPIVMMPNPFYQIYEGAAILAGAQTHFLNTTSDNDFLPDISSIPEKTWRQTQLVYICTPGNPSGRVMPVEQLQTFIELAERYDFVLASDECYSELYFDETAPPVGLLEAAKQMGNDQFRHCIVFHSLSKRSNLPGLRSGFVAGDSNIIEYFLKYRTYHGCAMPPPTQYASIAAWSDEAHVKRNRDLYRQKFDIVLEVLGDKLAVSRPDASFYLWPKTPIDDEAFTQRLFAEQNLTVLPGKYLSRESDAQNPGANRVRLALVADVEQCREAALRIREFLENI
jgi:N-succinyldiaminopimelate aminotransferase